jgi:hypothetical protein
MWRITGWDTVDDAIQSPSASSVIDVSDETVIAAAM